MANNTVYAMRNRVKYLLPVFLALLGILTFVTPVAADVEQPAELEIQEVSAYENTKEDGDQLYLARYYIAINSTYNANQLFIFRLFDEGGSEVAHATPYPYNDQGYGMGVVAFYLDADEAPVWGSGVYVMALGNPLISWNGTAPGTTMSIINWNTGLQSNMQIAVSGKILELAGELTVHWGIPMTTTTQGITVLTDYGANYFLQVVPYLTTIAPYVLGQYTFEPDYPIDEKPAPDSYADWLAESVEGTVFDLGPVVRAHPTGISQGALTAVIYYGFVILLLVGFAVKKGLKKGLIIFFDVAVIIGAFIGIPLVVTVVWVFFCTIATFWVFYKGTT